MNTLTSFLTSFCAACAFMGAIYMLCPEGQMSKPIKYVLSLVFLLSVIGAAGITVKLPKIDISAAASPKIQSEALEVSAAEYVISYTLTHEGINFRSIEVCTNKTEDGGIVINKVIIRSDCEREKILSALNGISSEYEVEIINE